MRVLVTGAAGFIGYHVAGQLLARGDEVIGLDNLNPYYHPTLKDARLERLSSQKKFRFEKIDRKAYDRLGNLRQKGEDEYKRCFTQNAPKQASFAEATRQAQRLLSAALTTR